MTTQIRQCDMPERLLHWAERSELSDEERQEEAKLAALKLAARRRRVQVHELLQNDFPQTADDNDIVVRVYLMSCVLSLVLMFCTGYIILKSYFCFFYFS